MSSTASQCGPTNSGTLKHMSSLCFDEKLFLQLLYKVLVSVSGKSPIILYIRDAEKIFLQSERLRNLFHKMLEKLSGPVLVLGSQIVDAEDEFSEVDERLATLFPYNIEIKPPEDEISLGNWNAQLEENMKIIQFQDNKKHIAEVLAANDIECNDLNSICSADTMVLSNYIEEIVVSAIRYHLMNTKDPEYRNGKLVISSESLSHGLNLFQEGKRTAEETLKLEANGNKGSAGGEGNGAKNEVRSDAQAPENKSETGKSIPLAKSDGENSTPKAAVRLISLQPTSRRFALEGS